MTWTRLGDDSTDEWADSGVSRSARLLLVELYVYGNRRLLDGQIPLAALPRLTDSQHWKDELEELRGGRLLDISDGCVVLDWSDQEARDVIERRRGLSRERQRKFALRKAAHAEGDHSLCSPKFCPNASGDASHNGVSNDAPTRPFPTRPVPKGQGQVAGAGSDSAGATPDRATEDDGPPSHRFIAPADSPLHCSICGHTRDGAPHMDVVA